MLSGLFSSCGSRGYSLAAVHRLQGRWASLVAARGFSSCGSQALEHRLGSCGTWVSLLSSTWDLPGSGIKFMSTALAGRFF